MAVNGSKCDIFSCCSAAHKVYSYCSEVEECTSNIYYYYTEAYVLFSGGRKKGEMLLFSGKKCNENEMSKYF